MKHENKNKSRSEASSREQDKSRTGHLNMCVESPISSARKLISSQHHHISIGRVEIGTRLRSL